MATEVRQAPAEVGLTTDQVRERVGRGEVNHVELEHSRSTAEIIRANVVTRFNILLGALLVVILVAVREPRDALFGIVLVTNALIGIVQELRAKATLDRLAVLTAPRVTVIRDGQPVEVDVAEVVRDDLVILKVGDQLPVDGTIVTSKGLEIDESLLTGESDAVPKAPGDAALSGSFVVAGNGSFHATRVGEHAYAVALAKEAKRFTLVRSELRDGVDWILRAITWIIGPIIGLLVWSQLTADAPFSEALRSAVAGAVGMVPQGLVLLTSLAFAVGVIRLGRRSVLVQELPAIEGLARVDTVCFDKTGTLTEGALVVQGIERLSDRDPAPALGALGKAESEPNATLRAVTTAYPSPGWLVVDSVPFSSARKWSAAEFGDTGTWVLGAPDIVGSGDESVLAKAEAYAAQGRRVLLLSYTSHPLVGKEHLPAELEPTALVVLGDTIRPDAADTLRFFADQGVAAKVISGDHPETVAAIAREVGVPGSQHVVDGRNLPEEQEALAAVMERNSVFGRVTPYQKRAMVGALQSRGHVVAMTGDGVNDVLALKDADIGIAVGSGSSASRSVAQLVLVDGSFATIPGVVAEGRRVISNIERVANLFVTKTIYAIFIALATGLALRPFPFLPRHLTLVGSVTIGIPAFFLALAPSVTRARPGFIKRVLSFSIPTGVAAGVATFLAYELALAEVGLRQIVQARTMATLVIAAVGLFALGMVSRPVVGWKKGLMWSMAALLVILFWAPASQDFFELDMPRPAILMAAVGIVAVTGAVMIGGLRAVGWIRQMPDYLREHPPDPSGVWQRIQTRMQSLFGADSTPPATAATAEPKTDTETDTDTAGRQPEADVLREIDWFDPDSEF
ncbi:MAG: HAD-IC family P-type ATPase [Acidimicrobiia bacterium]|nr:HAD-IC family P-type ATPase [Acidimicrobiia bacterium]